MSNSNVVPFETHDGLELASTAPESRPYLVDGLLLEVGVSMLVAKPKCGKSTFVRQLAYSVAEDVPFLGKTVRCGSVLLLNLEGQIGVVREHFRKLGLTGQRGKVKVIDERMPRNGQFGLQRLAATIRTIPDLRLVIVDTVNKLLRIPDTTSTEPVELAVEDLEALAKESGIHILFTQHARKRVTDDPGDAAIGNTKFRGGTDTNIFLVKDGSRRIIGTEQRWGTALEATYLTFDIERQTVELGTTVEAAEESRREARTRETEARIEHEILDSLLGKNLTVRELIDTVTGQDATKLKVLGRMESAGRVVAEQDGRAKRYSRVEIPTEERTVAA